MGRHVPVSPEISVHLGNAGLKPWRRLNAQIFLMTQSGGLALASFCKARGGGRETLLRNQRGFFGETYQPG